jgi:signal peptidase I
MVKKPGVVSIFLIAATLFAGITIRKYVFSISRVSGDSMNPTLVEGDLVFVEKWDREFKPDDIVVFQPPFSKTETLIKRLIAGPGSEVMVNDFKVMVNSKPYPESVQSPPTWGAQPFECRFSRVYQTRAREYFVMGDNRCLSGDSRAFGPISHDVIKGKVVYALKLGRRK